MKAPDVVDLNRFHVLESCRVIAAAGVAGLTVQPDAVLDLDVDCHFTQFASGAPTHPTGVSLFNFLFSWFLSVWILLWFAVCITICGSNVRTLFRVALEGPPGVDDGGGYKKVVAEAEIDVVHQAEVGVRELYQVQRSHRNAKSENMVAFNNSIEWLKCSNDVIQQLKSVCQGFTSYWQSKTMQLTESREGPDATDQGCRVEGKCAVGKITRATLQVARKMPEQNTTTQLVRCKAGCRHSSGLAWCGLALQLYKRYTLHGQL